MDLKNRLKDKLEEIAAILLHHKHSYNSIGVLGGSSGIALFHFYYARYKDDNHYDDKGSDIITETFSLIQEGFSYPTFCDGIAGACWALEVLKEEQYIELQEDIITPELDEYLLDKMHEDLQKGYYDFLHGATGYGYYFLKRYQNITSAALKKRYKTYIHQLITFFKDTAIQSDTGIWWQSEIKVGEEKFNGYNLGLSHGVASIINFLSRLSVYPDFSEHTLPLLRPAVNHMLNCKHTNEQFTSSFPNWITEEEPKGYNSRLAWCYGDPGIGISLLRAGEVLDDQKLYQEAIHVLKHSASRRDIVEVGLKDAGLCHGAFGLMHIYQHVFKKTGDTVCKETAEHWATVALDMATHTDGYAGYLFGYEGSWKSRDCLLDGIAGVGLAILSYLADFDTQWDEALLIG
ncbi:lanthionine synthetase C family protein [Aquimarina sp. MMG016]|uniref:lanthionine synthetase C family protein n=1 Tax=Aquimarina sp. MMG016 TaxID=2822690 RepID=UPI001B3A6CBA|nr:lanthionine synthetase C family protein [Aquimarina sp. MMG016]MBQ4818849.1 lanthionine synthetase C family protein [Aquimarina sp. MMG016]